MQQTSPENQGGNGTNKIVEIVVTFDKLIGWNCFTETQNKKVLFNFKINTRKYRLSSKFTIGWPILKCEYTHNTSETKLRAKKMFNEQLYIDVQRQDSVLSFKTSSMENYFYVIHRNDNERFIAADNTRRFNLLLFFII